MHLAGLLCDLGKLTLHEALIHTPVAAMTAEQAAEFKRHTVNAERILLPLKPLARVAAILRSHNERLDGLGYPDGLKGDAIPIESKVLHVVKDYDALLRKLILAGSADAGGGRALPERPFGQPGTTRQSSPRS